MSNKFDKETFYNDLRVKLGTKKENPGLIERLRQIKNGRNIKATG